MDEDRMIRIAVVLARTSELRSKIINCVKKAKESESEESREHPDAKKQEDDSEEEAESLCGIKSVLESIEGQLSSLQALHYQQWYEKESALAEIEYNRRKLLKELKTYKGKDLEVIKEVIAFAIGTEDDNDDDDDNDLPLPPYPTRPFSYPSTYQFPQNMDTIGLKNLCRTSKNRKRSGPFKLVKDLFVAAAKTAAIVAGLIAILNMAGYETQLRKLDNRDNGLKITNLFKVQVDEGSRDECPSGKVLVIENGEVRCVVKERVQVPFEAPVYTPDVGYGCG